MSKRTFTPLPIIILMALSFVLPFIFCATQKWALWFEKGNIVWVGLLSAAIFGAAQYLLTQKLYNASKLKYAVLSMIGSIFAMLFILLG